MTFGLWILAGLVTAFIVVRWIAVMEEMDLEDGEDVIDLAFIMMPVTVISLVAWPIVIVAWWMFRIVRASIERRKAPSEERCGRCGVLRARHTSGYAGICGAFQPMATHTGELP